METTINHVTAPQTSLIDGIDNFFKKVASVASKITSVIDQAMTAAKSVLQSIQEKVAMIKEAIKNVASDWAPLETSVIDTYKDFQAGNITKALSEFSIAEQAAIKLVKDVEILGDDVIQVAQDVKNATLKPFTGQ